MRKYRENNALFDVGDTVTTDSNEFSLDLKCLEKKKKRKFWLDVIHIIRANEKESG